MKFLQPLINLFSTPKKLILLYHHVFDSRADIWDIYTSPKLLESHIEILKTLGQIVPLDGMLNQKARKFPQFALTFDDGYLDNFLNGRPILEKHNVPATFFITNQSEKEYFWWDRLEFVLFNAANLPSRVILQGKVISLIKCERLDQEIIAKHHRWKAGVNPPPTFRAAVFLELWKKLNSIALEEKLAFLDKLELECSSKLIGTPNMPYSVMNNEKIKILGENKLFEIGSHSKTHSSFKYLDKQQQIFEISENKILLESLTSKPVKYFSLPQSEKNEYTYAALQESNIKFAFTGGNRSGTKADYPYEIPRINIGNWDKLAFRKAIMSML